MRFILSLPTDHVREREEFGTGAAVMEMARAAEAAGFEGVFVTDHPIPSDRFLASGGHHALEPTVALAFAAAATTRLRLVTNLYILAYRQPFIAAKAIASLDSLAGGRVTLGIGAGYLRSEFRALGVDFERRNELLDEALSVLKEVWKGGSIHVSGARFRAHGHTALPTPATRPHPPIWIGGNSRRAIRRAVAHGQGWMPVAADEGFARVLSSAPLRGLDDLRSRRAYALEQAERVGRKEPMDIAMRPFGGSIYGDPDFDAGAFADSIAALAELGLTHVAVSFDAVGGDRLRSRQDFLSRAERFAREVIEPCAGIGAGAPPAP